MSGHIILNNFIKNLIGNKAYNKEIEIKYIINAFTIRYEDMGETE